MHRSGAMLSKVREQQQRQQQQLALLAGLAGGEPPRNGSLLLMLLQDGEVICDTSAPSREETGTVARLASSAKQQHQRREQQANASPKQECRIRAAAVRSVRVRSLLLPGRGNGDISLRYEMLPPRHDYEERRRLQQIPFRELEDALKQMLVPLHKLSPPQPSNSREKDSENGIFSEDLILMLHNKLSSFIYRSKPASERDDASANESGAAGALNASSSSFAATDTQSDTKAYYTKDTFLGQQKTELLDLESGVAPGGWAHLPHELNGFLTQAKVTVQSQQDNIEARTMWEEGNHRGLQEYLQEDTENNTEAARQQLLVELSMFLLSSSMATIRNQQSAIEFEHAAMVIGVGQQQLPGDMLLWCMQPPEGFDTKCCCKPSAGRCRRLSSAADQPVSRVVDVLSSKVKTGARAKLTPEGLPSCRN